MYCPNCGNEIKENQKFCTVCGMSLDENKTVKNKKILILSIVGAILIIISIGTFLFIQNNKLSSGDTYKSIVPIEQMQIDKMSTKGLLNTAIEQDNDLMEILPKLSTQKSDKLFETFYKNLHRITNIADKRDDWDVTADENFNYKLVPDSKLWGFCPNDVTAIWIDHNYLTNRYSKYLDETWKKYLNLSANSQIIDIKLGVLIDVDKAIKEVSDWKEFLKQNPDFAMKSEIEKIISTMEQTIKDQQATVKQDNMVADETWTKIAEYTYFNPKSLKVTETGREGDFKFYNGANDNDILQFDIHEGSEYAIYKISIENNGQIMFLQWEYFDKAGNSIDLFIPRVFRDEKYTDYENGQLYYDALFKN